MNRTLLALLCAVSTTLLAETAPDPTHSPLVTRSFKVDPDAAQLWDDSQQGMQEMLTKLGVTWPTGSTLRLYREEGVLTVDNTPVNLHFIQQILSHQVEIELQWVTFAVGDIEKLMPPTALPRSP